MKYLIEHLDDGDVRLENEMDSEDTMRFSRDKLQAIHEASAVICAGDCQCYKDGYQEARERFECA